MEGSEIDPNPRECNSPKDSHDVAVLEIAND